MSKIIKLEDWFYTELTYYERYFKLWDEDKQPFLKFLSALFIAIITADISLIVWFKKYISTIIIISFLLLLLSIFIYLRFYKEPKGWIFFFTF